MSALDIVARGLASRALEAASTQGSPLGASTVGTADGGNVQQALNVAPNSDALVALETVFAIGSRLRTADGHEYLVIQDSGDLVTAGGVQLRILPDASGEFHFEAAAPNADMLYARWWAMNLPAGSVLNICGTYEIDSSAEFPNKICAKGPGKWTIRPGGPSAVVQLSGSGSEWYVDLDGNKDNITSGEPPALAILNADDVKVGARITNAKGNGIYATGSKRLRLLSSLRVSGAAETGVVVADGSDHLVIEDGAEVTDSAFDNIYISDANGAPCRHVSIGRVDVSRAGLSGSGYWAGLRLRYVEHFHIKGLIAHDCVLGAGWLVQSSVLTPESRFSRYGKIEGTICTGNNDGGILDDFTQFVTTVGNQLNGNIQDGMDINNVFGCVSMADTCNENGQKGILLYGSRSARVYYPTACNNAKQVDAAGNPFSVSDSGVVIQANSTGAVPTDCWVIGGLCTDTQPTKTQNYGVEILSGTNHRIEDMSVAGNKRGGINDASNNAVLNTKRRNKGYKTESSFWAVIPAGSTSVSIGGGSTGLVPTGVTIQKATAVPTGAYPPGYKGHTLSALNTQGFTINLEAPLTSDITFNCAASVYGDGAGM